MWWMSWLGEIGWHGLELLNDGEYEPIAPLMPTLKACTEIIMKSYEVSPACLAQICDFPVKLMLGMGLLSIWWHPKLQEKVGKENGRLRALPEYYKLQGLVTAARWAIWYWMPRTSQSDAPTQRAIHLFMALFSFVVSPTFSYIVVILCPDFLIGYLLLVQHRHHRLHSKDLVQRISRAFGSTPKSCRSGHGHRRQQNATV